MRAHTGRQRNGGDTTTQPQSSPGVPLRLKKGTKSCLWSSALSVSLSTFQSKCQVNIFGRILKHQTGTTRFLRPLFVTPKWNLSQTKTLDEFSWLISSSVDQLNRSIHPVISSQRGSLSLSANPFHRQCDNTGKQRCSCSGCSVTVCLLVSLKSSLILSQFAN